MVNRKSCRRCFKEFKHLRIIQINGNWVRRYETKVSFQFILQFVMDSQSMSRKQKQSFTKFERFIQSLLSQWVVKMLKINSLKIHSVMDFWCSKKSTRIGSEKCIGHLASSKIKFFWRGRSLKLLTNRTIFSGITCWISKILLKIKWSNEILSQNYAETLAIRFYDQFLKLWKNGS